MIMSGETDIRVRRQIEKFVKQPTVLPAIIRVYALETRTGTFKKSDKSIEGRSLHINSR